MNTLKIFLTVVVLALSSLVMSEAMPSLQFNVLESKWDWIRSRIYAQDAQPIDTVIIGSSGIWTAMDPELFVATGEYNRRQVLSFARNWVGRDVDYVIARHALEKRNVKNIYVEFAPDEVIGHHSYMKYVASMDDVLAEMAFYINPGPKGDQTDLLFKFKLRSIVHMLADMGIRVPRVMLGQVIKMYQNQWGEREQRMQAYYQKMGYYFPHIAAQQDPEFLSHYQNVAVHLPIQQSVGYAIQGTLPDFYLQRLSRLARQHEAQLYFVYMPTYLSMYPSPQALDYFSRMGQVVVPSLERLYKIEYWRDARHLTPAGARLFTGDLVAGLECLNE